LDDKNSEIIHLNTLIQQIQDDKTKLSKKITKYLENEKELVQELDAFKSARRSNYSTTTTTKPKNLTAKLDAHIKNIESERDYFKQEVETLQKILKNTQEYQLGDINSAKPRHNENKVTIVNRNNRGSPVRGGGGQTKCTVCCGNKQQQPQQQQQQRSQSRDNRSDEIITQLRRERDELQSLLDNFERHLTEIQSNVQLLTTERDKLNELYEASREELQRTRRELLQTDSKSKNASLATQTLLHRLESERDQALRDLRSIVQERESLKERLRLTTETAIREKTSLEQQIDDQQSMLRSSDDEKQELCNQMDIVSHQLEEMESKVHNLTYQLSQVDHDLNDEKSTTNQMRMLAEESDRNSDELRRQIVAKNDELRNLEQVNYRLEQKVTDTQELNRTLRDEISNLRMTINSIDKDKDKLAMNYDERTVENTTLKQELASQHRHIDELNEQLIQLDTALDRANDELKCKIKEVTNLKIQIDQMNQEMNELARSYDSSQRENKRFQDDLITVTRENQVIHCELDKSNGDKEHMKEQIQDYINEVSKFEDIVNQKEQDRSNLLDQYRDMSNEFNSMKITLNSFENESENLKMEIQMKNTDNRRLRERLDVVERDLQHQLNSVQEYEVKLSGANRNLQRLEEYMKKSQMENKDIIQDLMHCRDMNSRLEQAKEDLSRQLTSKDLDYEQLLNEIADKRAENDLLKSQVNSERSMVKSLEDLIAGTREKDYQIQLTTQERDAEIHLLKDRINMNDIKIQSQNKEISSLRSKIVEYEGENERIKRQLTNERFERERSAQELRKISDSSTSHRTSRCISPSRPHLHSSSSISCSLGSAAIAAAAAAVSASNAA
jgi:centrosomal protein CEP135